MTEQENETAVEDFADSGFYADGTLTPKAITVGKVKGLVYVKTLPVVELRRFQFETQHPDQKVREAAGLGALVRAIRKEDGSAHMTMDQAKKLKARAVEEMLRVFVEVNADKLDAEEAGNG